MIVYTIAPSAKLNVTLSASAGDAGRAKASAVAAAANAVHFIEVSHDVDRRPGFGPRPARRALSPISICYWESETGAMEHF